MFVVVAIASLLVVFPFADYFRRSDDRVLPAVPPPRTLVTDGSYSAFQMAMNGVVWVSHNGHTFGRQLTGAVLSFVPRAVWSDQPPDTGNMIGAAVDDKNRAAPMWTEFYVDFGLGGVFVGFACVGGVVAIADRRLRRPRSNKELAIVSALAPKSWYLLRGSLLPSFGGFVLFGGLMLLAFSRSGRPYGPRPAAVPAARRTDSLALDGDGSGMVASGSRR